MSERRPAEVFRPGEYVAEAMDDRNWSVETLAEKSGVAENVLTELLERDYPMTPALAAGLSRALGTSADIWINMDRVWQRWGPVTKGKRG